MSLRTVCGGSSGHRRRTLVRHVVDLPALEARAEIGDLYKRCAGVRPTSASSVFRCRLRTVAPNEHKRSIYGEVWLDAERNLVVT